MCVLLVIDYGDDEDCFIKGYLSLLLLNNINNTELGSYLSLHNILMSCLDEDTDADYQNIGPMCEEQHNQFLYLYNKHNFAKET